MKWVLSLEEEEIEDMKSLIWLPLPCMFMAFNTRYGRTARAHPARTRCSRLWLRRSARYGRVVRSYPPVPMVKQVTSYLLKFGVSSSKWYGRQYGLVCPYRWWRKLLVSSTKLPIFLPQAGDVVRALGTDGSHRTVGR
jgi:hypothetical protein